MRRRSFLFILLAAVLGACSNIGVKYWGQTRFAETSKTNLSARVPALSCLSLPFSIRRKMANSRDV